MNAVEIGWLAGMMEGEASIGAWTSNHKRNTTSSNTKYARVEISSVDHDVIHRIHEMTGVGNIHTHYSGKNNTNHKPTITWRVGTAEEVIHLLCTVVSSGLFSERRTQQILEAVEAASEVVSRKRSGESFSRKK